MPPPPLPHPHHQPGTTDKLWAGSCQGGTGDPLASTWIDRVLGARPGAQQQSHLRRCPGRPLTHPLMLEMSQVAEGSPAGCAGLSAGGTANLGWTPMDLTPFDTLVSAAG